MIIFFAQAHVVEFDGIDEGRINRRLCELAEDAPGSSGFFIMVARAPQSRFKYEV